MEQPVDGRASFSLGQFSTPTLVLMGLAIAINVAVGQLVGNVLKLPLYLDSIGTVVVGVLAGPLAGAATGALSNVIWGLALNAPTSIPFAITAAVIGFLAGVFGARGIFSPSRGGIGAAQVVVTGFATGIVAALVSAPIAYFVFGGTTGGGTDILVTMFRGVTDDVFTATLLQGGVSDPIDKTISYLVAWAILLAVPVTVKTMFPQGERSA